MLINIRHSYFKMLCISFDRFISALPTSHQISQTIIHSKYHIFCLELIILYHNKFLFFTTTNKYIKETDIFNNGVSVKILIFLGFYYLIVLEIDE